jgi:hypothetical protein
VTVGLRWSLISTACGWILSAAHAIRYTAVGTFFNQTLPSTIGGDAFRIWYLRREGSAWQTAAYSVLIDRAVGMFTLALLVLVTLPWTFKVVTAPNARVVVLAIGSVCVAGFLAFLAAGFIAARWRWLDRIWLTRHIAQPATIAGRMLASLPQNAAVLAYSLLVCLLSAIAWWSIARSIAAPLTFGDALILAPPISLLSTVPISIAGWGVRESLAVVAFSYVNIAQSDGLLMSIVFGLVSFATGLPGGALWASALGGRKRDEARSPGEPR